MKSTLFIIALLLSVVGVAQDSSKVKVETPKIVSKLQLGKLMHFDTVDIKFVEVVTDSRCPKNVSCVWAGEATVLIDIFKDGEKIEQKKLTFDSSSRLQSQIANIFASEGLNIGGLDLSPYPVYGEKLEDKDYYIQLMVSH